MSEHAVPSLWPREHGAYAQLGVALASALALAPALRSAGQGLLTAALFLASEPALVLLGRRGDPPPGVTGRAWGRLGLLVALAGLAGASVWRGSSEGMGSLLPVAVLGLGLFGLFLARWERTPAGEVLAAWTFAAAALPMAVAGGAGVRSAGTLSLLLAVLFTLGTALVHGHLAALRRRGARWPRLAAVLLAMAFLAGIRGLTARAMLPRLAWLIPLPMTLASLMLWLFPPAPRRLKAVGWAAAGCALAGAVLAVACLTSPRPVPDPKAIVGLMCSAAPASPWSRLASGWEELFPLRQARLDLALGLAAPGEVCLDAGCATGSLPRALASRGRVAHGLDLDPAFLQVARQRAEDEALAITWHEASLLELASVVAGQRFRLITCLGQTLPHLLEEDQWLAFFAQARLVLVPGGRLVIQAVHDGPLPAGHGRALPPLRCAEGTLERRRTMVSSTLASFETVFHPLAGVPIRHQATHRRMAPGAAAALLRAAGLHPDPPLADEAGNPFQEASAGWVLVARRDQG